MEHRKMRRFKQELGREECERVLNVCTHGVLALCGDGVHPYAVPLNFVYDGETIWFHSATSGQKLDEIAANPHVSFCVVEQDMIVPEEYTSYFRSVMVFGKIEIITDEAEALHGLKLLCVKYSPELDHTDELAKCGNRVKMLRLNIEHISGKEAIEARQKQKIMNVEELREYCLSLGEVEEKMPFGKFARHYDSTLVFYVMGHMFCMFDIDDFTWITVRSTADEIEEIKLNHTAVLPDRKNMRLWLNITLGGDIPDSMIYSLVSRAYEIIKEKYTHEPKLQNNR